MEPAPRICNRCGAPIVRRPGDGPAHYAKRKTCGREECRRQGNRYTMEGRALVKRHYPEGGAVAVWYQGWRHKGGGKRKQLAKIRLLASRMKVKKRKRND